MTLHPSRVQVRNKAALESALARPADMGLITVCNHTRHAARPKTLERSSVTRAFCCMSLCWCPPLWPLAGGRAQERTGHLLHMHHKLTGSEEFGKLNSR